INTTRQRRGFNGMEHLVYDSREQSVERPAKVWCYSGRAYAERPDSFLWEGKVQGVMNGL
ncbi:hypothetical protein M1O16_02830, partial [Dehalococcoidia bacterium]|nr:hypothetical protein [Dehalococcoidia bacterium]